MLRQVPMGLLTSLMVLALIACSDDSGTYSPENISSALPDSVGETSLVLLDQPSASLLVDPDGVAELHDRATDEWETAVAMYLEDPDSESGVLITAARLGGIEARGLLDTMVELMRGARTTDGEIAGRRVVTIESGFANWSWMFLYPKDEVLFMAGGRGPDASTMSEVLAALPK